MSASRTGSKNKLGLSNIVRKLNKLITKNPGAYFTGVSPMVLGGKLFVSVLANRFDGAAFEGFHTLGDFLFRGRLLMNEGVASFVVTGEKPRRRFAAQIAVNALLIDVKFARRVLGPLVGFVGHNWREQRVIGSTVKRAAFGINSLQKYGSRLVFGSCRF